MQCARQWDDELYWPPWEPQDVIEGEMPLSVAEGDPEVIRLPITMKYTPVECAPTC